MWGTNTARTDSSNRAVIVIVISRNPPHWRSAVPAGGIPSVPNDCVPGAGRVHLTFSAVVKIRKNRYQNDAVMHHMHASTKGLNVGRTQ